MKTFLKEKYSRSSEVPSYSSLPLVTAMTHLMIFQLIIYKRGYYAGSYEADHLRK